MSIEGAITSLLAPIAGGRRYWGRGEGITAKPYLILNLIHPERDYDPRGPTGYVQTRVQIDVYAETYPAAATTARAVVQALSGFRGAVAGTWIHGIMVDSESDLPASDAGEVSHLFRRSIDVIAHHQGD